MDREPKHGALAQKELDMPSNHTTPDGADPQAGVQLDAQSNDRGSPPPLVSEALVAEIETLPPLERRILHCLGAAVVIGWNKLPTDVQRTLFKLASATENAETAGELPARIARFLHEHKDDGSRR